LTAFLFTGEALRPITTGQRTNHHHE
jgi:hypothetical protein